LGQPGGYDASFADSGGLVVAVSPSTGINRATAVLVDPAGRIVLGGYSTIGNVTSFSLARLHGDQEVLYAAKIGGPVPPVATPGVFLTANSLLQPVFSYDFDGSTIVTSGGTGVSPSQITLITLDSNLNGTRVPVQGFTGDPKNLTDQSSLTPPTT